ncbi:MAG: pyroglutamyl-peptidase I [Candidatus Heimdallarchaeum aukensis]|uniref:Pyroglutamyl-peptidase I n=1 Tax=Candidatus Heimdallarchaeum aukensis TaxID=2876573 RepID=A0A9Y1FLP9_9ARCH|nr:MAG: pyroglutamyl-peptidase I [Candidatus Heimdallarchaeum aukensis]
MSEKEIILTGFEPFGESKTNPTSKLCEKINNKMFRGYKIISYIIPLHFNKINEFIEKIFESHIPSAFIATGQSNRDRISIERVAINFADARIPYNCGTKPQEQKLFSDGPVAYWSTLPVRKIKEKMIENNIPTELSYSAGTYGCNQLFYSLMHYITRKRINIPAGFIHVPSLPEQALNKKLPSMSLELIEKGIKVAIETVIIDLEEKNEG